MITLILKEFRELRVVTWLMLTMLILGYWFLPFERIDELSFGTLCPEYCAPPTAHSSWWGGFSILLLMSIFYVLFLRERDTGTVDFLNVLPVSFAKIFLSKILCALLLLWAYDLAPPILSYLLLLFNPDSVSGNFEYRLVASYTATAMIGTVIFSFYAVFFSWFRMVGVILFFLALIISATVPQFASEYSWVNIFQIYEVEVVGSTVVMQWSSIRFHLAASLLALFSGYILWRRSVVMNRPILLATRGKQWLWPLVVGIVALITSVTLLQIGSSERSGLGEEIERQETQHYTFVYREGSQQAYEVASANADSDFEKLAALFGAVDNEHEQPVLVNATETDLQGMAGVAQGRRIKVDFSLRSEALRHVLSHETVHYFQHTQTSGKFKKSISRMLFFSEGMAEYLSSLVVLREEELEAARAAGAVFWKRYEIQFGDLLNAPKFMDEFGRRPIYPLGEIWTAALASRCGKLAPVRLLEALKDDKSGNRLGNASDTAASEHWLRGLLATLDCDLNQVNDDWKNGLEKSIAQTDIDQFPVLVYDRIEKSSLTKKLIFTMEGEDRTILPQNFFLNYKLKLLLSGDRSVKSKHVNPIEGTNKYEVIFLLPDAVSGLDYIHYQVGYEARNAGALFFQRWRRASLVSVD